jgi:transcription-repair coupling factor (superfamily II helicase)
VLDFRPGETVVHANRGIAAFRGLERGETDGVEKEFLRLEFREGAHLLVPLDNADLVRRYVGVGEAGPHLSPVSGRGWGKKKLRVTDAVKGLARELLQIQAVRSARPGIAYPPDSAWQVEFENAFPFEETPDQLRAAEDIKRDMEASRPMDRLVCGDVGYGKTEIAMRAAFKAVNAGRQVAVLVPTTILAEQHYQTFRERFGSYPFFVEMISRFRTDAEQRHILSETAEGRVDLLIGTHRLIQPDVRFQNLGLVIIDEEQRFGVRHKEHLKGLRAVVDVLTLTATPIPRTLHLSLLGLRDISNLTTPPPGRQAIETKILRFDPLRVAEAIRREVDREGQVFFVHDRVETIPRMQKVLEELVPEARVGAVHGQMPKSVLRSRMGRFLDGEIEVLLTTTIIESGVDIPNVNTIFINNAHNFGLADLHQLRGRVGRFNRKAFAYLLLPRKLPIREIAEKRVRVVEEYSDLGAGFRIALRDMEIRGAGNIIGRDQSGHIAQVGYDMYCRLLRQAARQFKEPGAPVRTDVSCDLPVDTAVPEAYAGSVRMRLWIHYRLSAATGPEDLTRARHEVTDRFGPPPEPVENLFRLARMKLWAGEAGVVSVVTGGKAVYVEFESHDRAVEFLKKVEPKRWKERVYEEATALLLPPPASRKGPGLLAYLTKRFQKTVEGS